MSKKPGKGRRRRGEQAGKNASGQTTKKGIGLWHMLRDVLIASMNKGQFPLAMVGILFVIILIRMPAQDVGVLANKIYDDLRAGYTVGYALSIIFGSGWFVHAKWQRRVIHNEMARIASERTRLQNKIGSTNYKSSE